MRISLTLIIYKNRKAAYLSARAPVPTKIDSPCFCRALGSSFRSPGCRVWRLSRCSFSFVWSVLCFRPAFRSSLATLFFFIFGIRSLVSFYSFVERGVFDPRDIVSDHDGELHVAHCIAAAVGSEVFFDFCQPKPAARPVRVAASRTVLTSLLSDMVVYICVKNYSSSSSSSHARLLYAFGRKGLLFIFFINAR